MRESSIDPGSRWPCHQAGRVCSPKPRSWASRASSRKKAPVRRWRDRRPTRPGHRWPVGTRPPRPRPGFWTRLWVAIRAAGWRSPRWVWCRRVRAVSWHSIARSRGSGSSRRALLRCLRDRRPRRSPVGARMCRGGPGFRTWLWVGRRAVWCSSDWLWCQRACACRWMARSPTSRWAVVRSRFSWQRCPPGPMRVSSWGPSREWRSRGWWCPRVRRRLRSKRRSFRRPPFSHLLVPAPPSSRSWVRPRSRRVRSRRLEVHRTRGRVPGRTRKHLPSRRIRPRHVAACGRSMPTRPPVAAVAARSAGWQEASERLSRRPCGRRPHRGVRRPRPGQPVRRYPAPDSSRRSGRTRTPLAQVELWNSTASLMGSGGRSSSLARAGLSSGVAAAPTGGAVAAWWVQRARSVVSPRRPSGGETAA